MKEPEPSTARRVLWLLASALPMVFLGLMYWRFTIDFPYADQWDFVPLLQKAYSGQLGLHDFWAQHNEHRLVFPRLLMLGMALLSGWNIHWELAANFALALLAWAVLCARVRSDGAEVHGNFQGPVYVLFSLLIFSLSQWGNWFLGWQLQEFMNVLAVLVALFALSWRRVAGAGIAVAMVAGLVATYSFANGILVWPIGLLMLLVQRGERQRLSRDAMLWCGFGAAVVASYLIGYETPPHHAPLAHALEQPVACLLYFLAYLGQPVGAAEDLVAIGFEFVGHGTAGTDHLFSILMGGLCVLLWAVTLAQLLLSGVPTGPLLPWTGMALYALGTAALTSLGRVDEGVAQAVSSRYVTMANLLWLPVIVQVYWVAQLEKERLFQRALPIKVAILCLALAGSSLAGSYRWTERYNAFNALREEVRSGSDVERLRPVYPPAPEVILERRPILNRTD